MNQPTSSPPAPDHGDLIKLYIEQTKKLAAVCAALGLMPDEDIRTLTAQARKVAADRQRLLELAKGNAFPTPALQHAITLADAPANPTPL